MPNAAVLARVDARDSQMFSPLYGDFLSGDDFLLGRFPCSYGRVDCWPERARQPRPLVLGDDAWRELAAWHERLGAPAATRHSLEALATGRAVAVVAGQQPDALGGPGFTLHKLATAVAAARRFREVAGVEAVPVFWCASEDSDFDEIRTVRFLGGALEPFEFTLPGEAATPGGMVGAIANEYLAPGWQAARKAWQGLPGAAAVGEWLDAAARTRDLGEAQAVLVLRAFAEHGVVVVDPRLPAFRRAARPLYERYLERAAEVRDAVERAGDELETRGYARPVHPTSSEFSLFEIEDATRRKSDAERARAALAAGRDLTPNVVLRPVVQDALLPAVIQVAGPGEVAYLSQLRGAFEALETPMSTAFPRLSATWLPAPAARLVREHGLDPWELTRDPDGTLKKFFAELLPAESQREFERQRAATHAGLERFAEASRAIDASLPQLVESVRAKVDYQYKRLLEGMVSKVRSRFDREHPAVGRLHAALWPQDKPQERRLSWLDGVARGGPEVVAEAVGVAAAHVDDALAGRSYHYLIPYPREAL